MSIHFEEQIASLVAAGGILWAVQVATAGFDRIPPGPLEVCSVAILVWLHAKWRRSIRAS